MIDPWNVPSGNDKIGIRVMSLLVHQTGQAQFDESSIHVKIVDEAAGEYVALSTPDGTSPVTVDCESWPTVRAAIDFMVGHCRDDKEIQ